jgi:hypothetical protein
MKDNILYGVTIVVICLLLYYFPELLEARIKMDTWFLNLLR